MESDQEGLIKYIPHAFSPTRTPSVSWLLQAFHRGGRKLTAGFEFGSMYYAFSSTLNALFAAIANSSSPAVRKERLVAC